ncbi:putative ATP-dependent RNA helicase DDX59 [Glandiceps talaboti]
MFVPRSVSKGGGKKPSLAKKATIMYRDKNVTCTSTQQSEEQRHGQSTSVSCIKETEQTKETVSQHSNLEGDSEISSDRKSFAIPNISTEVHPSTPDITTEHIDSVSSLAEELTHDPDLHIPNKDTNLHLPNNDVAEDDVISYSKDQRWPEHGEPVCIMCGRYAEYICEQTDVDICSLECKAKHLAKRNEPVLPIETKTAENLEREKSEESVSDRLAMSELNLYVYKDHEEIIKLREEQVEELRTQLGIKIRGSDVPKPILEFRHLSLQDKLNANLQHAGYELPTAVQMQVIPTFLSHRDMMVSAHTSTGKTVSFLLPSIVHIHNHMTCSPGNRQPLVLVLSPTRELCMQIEEQAKELMQGLPRMKTALLVGGLPMPPQLYRLRKGVQFVVATPGRLRDIIDQEGILLSSLKIVVIDEVDTMLHMGFQEQVMNILKDCPETVQTMLCSATIPHSIEKMASMLLANPVYVSVGEPSMPNEAVRQIIIWVEEPSKKKKLYSILQDPKYFKPPMVVFVESRVGADLLAASVYKVCGLNCLALHGEKQQKDRSSILQQFLDGDIPVLVCTGLVGRGIDFPKAKMAINFDMPTTTEQYIHQVGRAGRLGERGMSITFINNGSKYLFVDFVRMLQSQNVTMPTELMNSSHLHHQQQKRKLHSYYQHRKQKGKKRKGQQADDSDSD